MINFKCAICDDSRIRRVISRRVGGQVIECDNCGHLMLWPLLNDKEVLAQYTYSEVIESKETGAAILDNMAFKLLKRGDKRENLSVLDIGCGLGEFLNVCKKSAYNVIGIDITKSVVNSLNEKGYEVYQKSLSDYCEMGKSFDWVSCLNLIEHVNNPMEAIEQLASLVKSKGRLVIQTPNGDAIKKYGERAYGLHVDKEHLNYFSADQLVKLFNKYNFKLKVKKYYPSSIRLGRVPVPKKNNAHEAKFILNIDDQYYRKLSNPTGVRTIVEKLPPTIRGTARSFAQIVRYIASIDEILKGKSHEFIIVLERE